MILAGSFFSFLSHKIKSSDLALITRQMSTLINAGIPVDRSLDSVAEQLSDKSSANKLKEISMRVKEGYKFSEALKEFPESFDSLYVSLIEAGESSGELGNVMEETADYLEKRATLNQEILGATIYPMVLFATSLVIISLLLIFVVPNVVSQFANSNQQLPFLTMAMLGISNFFTSSLYLKFGGKEKPSVINASAKAKSLAEIKYFLFFEIFLNILSISF